MDMYKIKKILESAELYKPYNSKPAGESVVKKTLKEDDMPADSSDSPGVSGMEDSKHKNNVIDEDDEENDIFTADELAEGFNSFDEDDEDDDYEDDDESRSDQIKLLDIMDKVGYLIREANNILKSNPEYYSAYSRAKSYWIPNILGSLDGRATMTSMKDTIDEISRRNGDD